MHVLPRLRLELARRPWIYWLIVGLCALVVWSGITRAASAADAERRQWGQSRTVLVATVDVARGQTLRARRRQYPAAMVPVGAVASLPAAALAAHPIGAGEVIVRSDLAGGADPPADWVVFALPADGAPALLPGDAATVFGDGTRWCDGMVVTFAADRIDVAVPPTCAEHVSAQVAAGTAVLARTGRSSLDP